MRTSAMRAAMAAILLTAAGCSVTDTDIEHWKRTVRGPRRITAVLLGQKYPKPLRIHAARALIEMKHPNVNGLELLTQALTVMSREDREGIVHELIEPLKQQLRGQGQQQTAAAPTDPMIRAKDAGYLLLRYTSAEDRRDLANELMAWIMTDLRSRALSGQFTAEQIVQAIGPDSSAAIIQAINGNDDVVTVMNNLAQLLLTNATDAAKDGAARRMVSVCDQLASDAETPRLRQFAEQQLRARSSQLTPERIEAAVRDVRERKLSLMHEALVTMNRPAGTEYFLRVAGTGSAPIQRRKDAMTALQGHVRREHSAALLALATSTAADVTDELRGMAVDRLGETQNATVVPQLWTLFDTANGGLEGDKYVLRWKLGEAILKLGGASIIPAFMQHLSATRATPRGGTPFGGYTYAEINGYAGALAELTPTPRDLVRAHLGSPLPHVRAVVVLFLARQGQAPDEARLGALVADATPMVGPGWTEQTLETFGKVARRAQESLGRLLRPAAAAGQDAGAPTAAAR
jgi:hypothetical protein